MPDAPGSLTASAVAELVGGRLEGDGTIIISAVSPLERAHGRSLSLLTSGRYVEEFRASRAAAVLIPKSLTAPSDGPAVRIFVADPQAAMAVVTAALFPGLPPAPGIHPTAVLGRDVVLGEAVSIGPGAVVGPGSRVGDRVVLGPGVVLEADVIIGPDSDLGPHVTCYRGVTLGARVRVKAGAVIGGTGFGYISDRSGHRQIPHVGGCVLGDDVHLGSNSCVDRGSIDDTVIGRGTKIDNQVHVGHNAQIGERCLLMGGVLVAGSARIGDDAVLAGGSAIAGHLRLGDRVRIGAMSAVTSSIAPGVDVSGYMARPHREHLRAQAALYRLAKIVDRLETLASRESNHDA